MKAQIVDDVVVAYGNHLYGDDVFDAPDDYTFETYTYFTDTPGEYNPNGFSKIEIE